MDNFSLSDVAAVTRGDNNGMFGCGGGGMWTFALLILLLIGNGGLFGGHGERAAPPAGARRWSGRTTRSWRRSVSPRTTPRAR